MTADQLFTMYLSWPVWAQAGLPVVMLCILSLVICAVLECLKAIWEAPWKALTVVLRGYPAKGGPWGELEESATDGADTDEERLDCEDERNKSGQCLRSIGQQCRTDGECQLAITRANSGLDADTGNMREVKLGVRLTKQ